MKDIIPNFSGIYRPLSNFWYAFVTYDGDTYQTNEHAFQAAKAIHKEHRDAIRMADGPGEAKRMGKQVPMRKDWEDVKIGVMRDLIRQKFSDLNPELVQLLLGTGSAILVEGNTWGDVFWGVCNGNGRNELGKLLMERRDELFNELEVGQ